MFIVLTSQKISVAPSYPLVTITLNHVLGTSIKRMGENSAEYSTLIDLTSGLRLAIRSELISLTGSLLATRLISLDNDNELRNTAHSEVERSARLVELVQNKVRQNPRHYHSFIGILQENQDQYRDILQQLEQTYQAHQQEDGKSARHM